VKRSLLLFCLFLCTFLEGSAQIQTKGSSHLDRGRAYLASGDLAHAEQELQVAAELSPDDPATNYLLGIIEARLGAFDKARNRMLKSLELDPANSEAYNDLGVVELQMGSTDAALADFRKSIALNTRVPAVYYNLGKALLQSRQFSQAASAFEQGHTLSPQDPDMLYGFVSSLVEMGDSGRLGELLPSIQNVFGNNENIHIRIARAFSQKHFYELAAAEFAFLSSFSTAKDVAYERAEAEYMAGQLQKAMQDLPPAPLGAPDAARLRRLRGSILSALGLFAEANNEFREVIQLNPTDPENYILCGKLLIDGHDPEDAIQLFREASHKFPQHYQVWLGLGMAYKENHQHQDALNALRQAIAIDSRRPQAYSVEGFVWTALGRHGDARGAYQKAMDLDPHGYLAPYFYAIDLDRDGGHDREALPFLERSLFANPEFALAYFQAGKIYLRLGDLPRARDALEKAIEISPTMERTHYLLATVYQRMGNSELARQEFERFEGMKGAGLASENALKEEIVLERAAAHSILEGQTR
jgi:tetratricopeptide (TPR) repeat protein